MKRELEGIVTKEKDQLYIKTDDGKLRLVYNMFDGLTGKKIKIAIEEIEEEL